MKELDFREVYAGFFKRVHLARNILLGCTIIMGGIILAFILLFLLAVK